MIDNLGYRSIFYQILFAEDAPEERKLSFPVKYLIIFVFFALIHHVVTAWGFAYRGVDWLAEDPGGYVATAHYIAQHGYMPTENLVIYRQFAGLSLMMVVANLAIGNMVISGYVVVIACALASLTLTQYLFCNFRLSLISCVFLPYWITTTCTIFSEAPTVLCFLIGLWALRDFCEHPVLLLLAMLIAGFSLVIRQNAFFFILPFIFIMGWKCRNGNFLQAVILCSVAMLPILIYLSWNWITIHELFPQLNQQRESLLGERALHPNPSRYSATMLDVPFRRLWGSCDRDPSRNESENVSAYWQALSPSALH